MEIKRTEGAMPPLDNNTHIRRVKLVEFALQRVSEFKKRNYVRKNFIEEAGHRLTNGDPTLQRLRDKVFFWPASLLILMRFSPTGISMLGIAFAIVAAWYVQNPPIFACFIILNLLCDGIDGVCARMLGKDSDFGSIVDITSDTFSLLVVSLGLVAAGSLSIIVCVPYVILILIYTYRSALKNKILCDTFLSIGSRILAFSGLAVIAIFSWMSADIVNPNQLIDLFFGLIVFLLGSSIAIDVISTRKYD